MAKLYAKCFLGIISTWFSPLEYTCKHPALQRKELSSLIPLVWLSPLCGPLPTPRLRAAGCPLKPRIIIAFLAHAKRSHLCLVILDGSLFLGCGCHLPITFWVMGGWRRTLTPFLISPLPLSSMSLPVCSFPHHLYPVIFLPWPLMSIPDTLCFAVSHCLFPFFIKGIWERMT